MQWKDVAARWSAYLPRIMTKWPTLDEAEVQSLDGDQEGFIRLLARAKGDDMVAAQMELADWLMGAEPADVIMDSTRDNARISASARSIPTGEDALSDDAKFGDDNLARQPMQRAS